MDAPDRNPNQVKFVGNLAGGEHKKQAQPKVGAGKLPRPLRVTTTHSPYSSARSLSVLVVVLDKGPQWFTVVQ